MQAILIGLGLVLGQCEWTVPLSVSSYCNTALSSDVVSVKSRELTSRFRKAMQTLLNNCTET